MSRQNAVHFGIKALGASLAMTRVLRLATTVVLARILAKEAFGLVTMATAAMFALSAFREIGLSQALIHRQDEDEQDLRRAADTAFVMVFGLNLLLFTIGWVLTPYLAREFDHMQGLESVLRAMLLIFLVEGVSTTPAALLQKRLDFGLVSSAEVLGALSYSVIAITLAALGHGVWSLVYGQLISRGLQSAWLVRSSGWRPRLRLHGPTARELFHYGKWLWATAAMQAISRSADKLVIGKVSGSASLGAYGVAYNLCSAPVKPARQLIVKLAFPAMSQLRDDHQALARAYARAMAMIGLLAMPAAVGLATVADEFVVTVYGRKWQEIVPLVRVLAFYGLANTIGAIARPVLLAHGRPGLLTLVWAGRQVAFIGLLFAIGGRGTLAVTWAVFLPLLGAVIVGHWIAARVASCPLRSLLVPLVRTSLATGVMLAAVLAVEAALDPWHPAARLAGCVLTGVAVYLAATLAVNRETFQDLVHNARGVARSKGRLT